MTVSFIFPEAVIANNSRVRLVNRLSCYSFLQLIGLQYATESLKSVFLTLATVSSRLHVDEAVELALLEQKYQSDIWGKVCIFNLRTNFYFCFENLMTFFAENSI